jgi:hypothetical protein
MDKLRIDGLLDNIGLLNNIQLLTEENKRMQKALEEIRDVARVSEGVEFYAMLADRGLGDVD